MVSPYKKFIFLASTILIGILLVWWFSDKNSSGPTVVTPPASLIPASTTTVTGPVTSTLPVRASSTTGLKVYTNIEYGFGFQYPGNLIIRENTFGSPYSKFNLQVEYWNAEGKYLSVFDVNAVLPEFADRAFFGVGATTSTVIVDGVPGVKYEYEFESLPEAAVVLPLEQYKVILGIGGSSKFYGHEGTFDQILASFKFLK
jgi:hypothetical protein